QSSILVPGDHRTFVHNPVPLSTYGYAASVVCPPHIHKYSEKEGLFKGEKQKCPVIDSISRPL
ncbi:MAG: hypothetical protein KDE62_12315, partial [Calditrichaeota bacterium]|nr:hypothetical protein [Calditrichota bacterium]MCB0317074.1 hypothetical protein [Calditrichota bacterium]